MLDELVGVRVLPRFRFDDERLHAELDDEYDDGEHSDGGAGVANLDGQLGELRLEYGFFLLGAGTFAGFAAAAAAGRGAGCVRVVGRCVGWDGNGGVAGSLANGWLVWMRETNFVSLMALRKVAWNCMVVMAG